MKNLYKGTVFCRHDLQSSFRGSNLNYNGAVKLNSLKINNKESVPV